MAAEGSEMANDELTVAHAAALNGAHEDGGDGARSIAMSGSAASGVPAPAVSASATPAPAAVSRDPFIRAENEDDDGYDPYSDRLPDPEPLFERDPWR